MCEKRFEQAVDVILYPSFVHYLTPFFRVLFFVSGIILFAFVVDRASHLFLAVFHVPNKINSLKLQEFPHVCVQLPMFNERHCCLSAIDSLCFLEWPNDKLCIQVVDDSTEQDIVQMIEARINLWKSKGKRIQLIRRPHRNGFKAGALENADQSLSKEEFIAIFDADFLPKSDFLMKTVPLLVANKELALVQTRWTYLNGSESLLTRCQRLSLNYHFLSEQQARSSNGMFFNFNGTGGVWRRSAMTDAGGWHSDTLVEDMDLSIRAYCKGWKFLYLNDVECLNEIPCTLRAYRTQQYRWCCGPMQVLRKSFPVIYNSNLPLYKKAFCFWFFLRYFVHMFNFFYFLVLLPLTMWIPHIAVGAFLYNSLIILLATFSFTPSEWSLFLPYLFFENGLTLFKAKATFDGLFNLGQSKQWIVTPKLGPLIQNSKISRSSLFEKLPQFTLIQGLELLTGIFLLFSTGFAWIQGLFGMMVFCAINSLIFGFMALSTIKPCL